MNIINDIRSESSVTQKNSFKIFKIDKRNVFNLKKNSLFHV